MEVKEYERYKEKLEALKAKQAKIDGGIEAIMKQLKAQGIDSIEDAKIKLEELRKQMDETEKRYDESLEELKGLHTWQFL